MDGTQIDQVRSRANLFIILVPAFLTGVVFGPFGANILRVTHKGRSETENTTNEITYV